MVFVPQNITFKLRAWINISRLHKSLHASCAIWNIRTIIWLSNDRNSAYFYFQLIEQICADNRNISILSILNKTFYITSTLVRKVQRVDIYFKNNVYFLGCSDVRTTGLWCSCSNKLGTFTDIGFRESRDSISGWQVCAKSGYQ